MMSQRASPAPRPAPSSFSTLARTAGIRGFHITRYRPPDISAALDGIDSEGWIVEDNEIDHNGNGDARTYGLRIGSRWTVRRNRIHDNGWVGISGYNATDTLILQNTGSDAVFTTWNNRFVGNHYDVSGNPAPFRWLNGSAPPR